MYVTKQRFLFLKAEVEKMIIPLNVEAQFYLNRCDNPTEIIKLAQELGCKIMYQKNDCEWPWFVFELKEGVQINVFQ